MKIRIALFLGLLMAPVLPASGLPLAKTSAPAQEVYFGVADQWPDLLKHPDDWTYVAEHANGFYLNFVMMNRVSRHTAGLSEASLAQTGKLLASHCAYLESDIRSPASAKQGGGGGGADDGASAEQERQYIKQLHQAGCKILYTSLNYGWSQERADHLRTFDLLPSEHHRLNLVQTAPWAMNGDLAGPSDKSRSGYNERTRQQILAADGVSTDGPLGYWMTDNRHVRSATVSLIRFAHAHHKRVMIMLATDGARQSGYDAKKDYLRVGQEMVRYLERERAVPDVWSVFEYATDIPATPEQMNGQPANTTSGLAYWLIKHIQDPRQFP